MAQDIPAIIDMVLAALHANPGAPSIRVETGQELMARHMRGLDSELNTYTAAFGYKARSAYAKKTGIVITLTKNK